ncbi:SagB family peptide dehydrogenase [Alicyclobacillus sp. ALC3]|uniref:SagB family peptide dehydrogenase n=1 Tax=Alicyclobacillus sp. ALC3 TaxID=2796143 RepID=UPI0023797E62|nr:SagB family peptide dehydrogenase [Alicyclobacillus sp. ALC3]WDL98349.1 SagB family peptide dehydrogenase [Alicyclobacillus sp. ALC3]
MQLDDFLLHLHFDIDKVRPVDAQVDWEDAPLPFKLYQGLPTIPLPPSTSLQTPMSCGGRPTRLLPTGNPSLQELATLFWYTYGLTHLSHAVLPRFDEGEEACILQALRRFVPSGGALYPSELYAYLRVDAVPPGFYHYDVAHHRLVLLRAGNYDTYLECALGRGCHLSSAIGVLFVSTVFWKNYFKYHDFAYRLQGLDAGVLVGQSLSVAEVCGYSGSVYFQFLDRAMNHILGLDEKNESVYAVIPLHHVGHGPTSRERIREAPAAVTDEVLTSDVQRLNHRHYVKSQRLTPYPLLREANLAAMFHSTDEFRSASNQELCESTAVGEPIPLHDEDHRLADFDIACRQRFSPALDFTSVPVSLKQLTTVLRTTARLSYTCDTEPTFQPSHPPIQLAVCVHGIDGIQDGAYLYAPDSDALHLLRSGDVRMELQYGLSMPTVNLFQVPLCFHLVGAGDHRRADFGYRGYRIQQMEVGIALQRLLLAASAVGLAGHPLLGYDEAVCDRIYHFDSKRQTCLLQVPMGRYRKQSRFEGRL